MTFENAVIPESLHELSRMIMQALPEIIKKKESTLKFANVSDLMFHYIQGDLG
jgi:hypothetical protein